MSRAVSDTGRCVRRRPPANVAVRSLQRGRRCCSCGFPARLANGAPLGARLSAERTVDAMSGRTRNADENVR
jgi:hypothetical protein